jgi:bifunctional UDP-N-acetylglucosamine pyrophosphorylase/glucosamine-1-phosphate N-acetyltransferase
VIKSGSYIEGPVYIGANCKIGPNCYLRAKSVFGDEAKVGNACEIKNSIFFKKATVGHLSYVGDSILGEHVNFGAGTIAANLRHDDTNIRSMVKGELIDTGRRKLGVIVGDGVHTGIHTSIYPGRKLWPGMSTTPGEIVQQDKTGA